MKFYIAASFEIKDRVLEIFERLKKHGHTATVDWTQHRGVEIEQRDMHPEKCQQDAETDIKGVQEADILVLLTEPTDGRAKYVELGIAMQSNLTVGKPLIYVVGEKTNQSIMYYHPIVNRRASIDEVLEEVEKRK